MLILTTDTVVRTFSSQHTPAATVKSGDEVKFFTLDSMGNQWRGQADYTLDNSIGSNPATGPVYVEGAEPGDTLKVTILDIVVGDECSLSIEPGNGVFSREVNTLKRQMFPIRDGKLIFNDKVSVDIDPMIGVIGVAPKGEPISNSHPGDHGGNMDVKRIGKGVSVYLPVNHRGALLALGDVHAIMSDGEACYSGTEVTAEVTVRIEVVKRALDEIMIVGNGRVITVASDESMEEAGRRAMCAMRRFLVSELGMDEFESCTILSVVGDMCICQAVSRLRTCRTEVPLSLFEAYGYSFDKGLPVLQAE